MLGAFALTQTLVAGRKTHCRPQGAMVCHWILLHAFGYYGTPLGAIGVLLGCVVCWRTRDCASLDVASSMMKMGAQGLAEGNGEGLPTDISHQKRHIKSQSLRALVAFCGENDQTLRPTRRYQKLSLKTSLIRP